VTGYDPVPKRRRPYRNAYPRDASRLPHSPDAALFRREVDLVGRVVAAIARLLAGASASWAGTALARRARDIGVLARGSLAGALAGGTGAARAARPGHRVLGRGLVACTVQGRLLAAGAGSGLRTSALGIAIPAAGGSFGDSHCSCWRVK